MIPPLEPFSPAYVPRDPSTTVLYRVVADHLETFLASLAADPDARGLPAYVEREFYDYLQCGVLAHGFLRLGCDTFHHELLLAFSCKRRGFCPSCAGRRMAQTAAHLVERVVYPTTADNYFASKPGKMPPTSPVLEGARPWSHTFFITNSPCWHSHGSSLCCRSLRLSQAYPPRPCQRSPRAHAPPRPNRLRASRTGLPVLCVSERPYILTPLLRCRPIPCPQRTDALGWWTPRGIFVPTPIVTIAVGGG